MLPHKVDEDPLNTNYSCSPSVLSIVRTIYELDDYDTMTDNDIKEWINSTLDYYYWFFNPDVDKYDDLQIYRVRSFFYAGTLMIGFKSTVCTTICVVLLD